MRDISSTREYNRILWMHRTLKKGPLTKRMYQEEFEMSASTFHRDMDKLRDYLHSPVVWDGSAYRYSDETFELPSLLVSEQEMMSLVLFGVLLEGYKGTPLYATVQRMYEHLAVQMQTDLAYWYVDAPYRPVRDIIWQYIEDLVRATHAGHMVDVVYESFSSGKTKNRRIRPYHLYHYEGEYYCAAYCYERMQVRDFFVGRIRSLTICKEKDTPIVFDIRSYLSDKQWGIMKGGTKEQVVFRIRADKARWLEEEFGHVLRTTKEEDGWIYYETEVIVNNDFLNWAVEFNKGIVILEPAHVRAQVIEHCTKILEHYS